MPLPDCMRCPRLSPALATLSLAAIVVVGLLLAPRARADGDPASDVLVTQSLFLPQDAAATEARQRQLAEVLAAAARSGSPIRVAVIPSRSDLGSVTALWAQPQLYARFLAQELAFAQHGDLIVVMPNGYGLARLGPGRPPPSLGGLSLPGRDPASAAIGAVVRVAAARGHPVAVPPPRGAAARGAVDLVTWLTLAAGVLVIIACWTISFRLQPPGRLRGPEAGGQG